MAELYGVETKRVNEAVRNNQDKFLEDFYFELTDKEFEYLRSKNSTANVKFISLIVFTPPIRTIFIDITTISDSEAYRLLEICFKDDLFDKVEVFSTCEYRKEIGIKQKYVNLHPKGISSLRSGHMLLT